MSRLLLPPVNRAMTTLDRSFFQKTVLITAAHVYDAKNLGRVNAGIREDLLTGIPRMSPITRERNKFGDETILLKLKPEVERTDLSTVSENTRELVRSQILTLVPYKLHLKYENWTYEQLFTAILPAPLIPGSPTNFAHVGHIAHLNLRNEYLPYKHLLAAIILDKYPHITTVINKIQDVGSWSEFRTFPMELLAGTPDTNVVVHQQQCVFHFDFAKVYWNTRLKHEHERLLALFKPGEAIADAMAGVGPLAIPAAKKRCIVWANDLNPHSYTSLRENCSRNKVSWILRAFNLDARDFIRQSIRNLYKLARGPAPLQHTIIAPAREYSENVKKKLRLAGKTEEEINPPAERVRIPQTFAHFIMDMPTAATTYLDAFIGAYNGMESIFFARDGTTIREMPLIHCYAFNKSGDSKVAGVEICAQISAGLGGHCMEVEDLVHLERVRKVGPEKGLWCASFRLPVQVAFADVPPPREKDSVEVEMEHWCKWMRDD